MEPSAISITVWAPRDTPRLRYVLDWLIADRLGLSYVLTTDKAAALSASHGIAYGWMEELPGIHAASLLWETDVKPQPIAPQEWQGLYTLFFDGTSPCDIQFDLLSGIFYLLSRYEEYLPFTPDRHKRFPAEASAMHDVLERPVADEWVEAFRQFLEQIWNVSIPPKPFSFQPTYDIDIAWSYRFKGWKRALGGALQDVAGRKWADLKARLRVMRGAAPDPYDSFIWILTQHIDSRVRPVYFILAAAKPSAFDKNISPLHPRMSSLIKALSEGSLAGLHPSYYSDVAPARLRAEQATLEQLSGISITRSRQHFIKLRFPQTYHALIAAGITDDYSMGYSTRLGFRGGTGASFLWYDLPAETATGLRVHPFAFMDSTAHYDLGLDAAEAFGHLRQMTAQLQACHGQLVTILHNYSLGTAPEWKGWRGEYQRFLRDVAQPAS